MPSATSNSKNAGKVAGLRYWMLRVLDECDFAPDPVHDLRVALRRCRSMADGLIAMDPDPAWKAMKKAGKRLFQRLGTLRDIHIMIDWIEKLAPAEEAEENVGQATVALVHPSASSGHALALLRPSEQYSEAIPSSAGPQASSVDPAAHALLQILARREEEQKHEAHSALEEFDRKQWRQWAKSLPQRAARIRPGSALFKHLALERWTEARRLHQIAMRNRSQTALHQLRIGIKRFRYIVENFLPAEHAAWSSDLKKMQDLLGEVHDLDVLWDTAVAAQVFPSVDSRRQWHKVVLDERSQRIMEYHEKMVGPDSLWHVWRAALPEGKQIPALATRRMKLWANALDPDFAHSERVAALALQLHDGLVAAGLLPAPDGIGARSSLQAAALLHDIGKSKGKKGHHKISLDLIKSHGTPLGWKPEDMHRAAVVARFHCGALPTKGHKALRDLLPNEQKVTIQLAAILRLANAFDAAHNGHIRRVRVETEAGRNGRTNGFLRRCANGPARNEAVIVAAEGYTPSDATAQAIAAERHLLEMVLHRPVVVRAMKTQATRNALLQIR
ncbi:MAG: CHAD domain-containing protein [Candidatus Sulfotelmatobacter sp.]